MSQPQHYSGPELGALLARVRTELGEDATILEANKVRSGGIGGFFTKESFQITASNEDDPSPTLAGLGSEATALMNDDLEDFDEFESVRDYLAHRDQFLDGDPVHFEDGAEDALEPLDIIGDLSHTLADKRLANRNAGAGPRQRVTPAHHSGAQMQPARASRDGDLTNERSQHHIPDNRGGFTHPIDLPEHAAASSERPSISLDFDRLGPAGIPSRLQTSDTRAARTPVPTPGPLRTQLGQPAQRQTPQSIGSIVADRLMERAELMNALEHLESTDQMIEAHQDGATHSDLIDEASFDAILNSTLSESHEDDVDVDSVENALTTAEAVALRIAEQNSALYEHEVQQNLEVQASLEALEAVIDVAEAEHKAAEHEALVLTQAVHMPAVPTMATTKGETTDQMPVAVPAFSSNTEERPAVEAVEAVLAQAFAPEPVMAQAATPELVMAQAPSSEPVMAQATSATDLPVQQATQVLTSVQPARQHSDDLAPHSPLPSSGGAIPDRLVESSDPAVSSREPQRPASERLGSVVSQAESVTPVNNLTSSDAFELEEPSSIPEIEMLESLSTQSAPVEPAGARQRPDFWTRMALAKEETSLYQLPKAKVTAIIGPLDLALPTARRCQNEEWIGAENLAVLSQRTSIPGLPSWQTVSKVDDLYWAVNEWRETQQRGLVVVDTNELGAEQLIRLVASIRSNGADMVRVTLPAGVDLDAFLAMAADLGEPVAVDLPQGTSPEVILAALDAGLCVASIGACALTPELLVALRSEVNGD